MAGHIGLELRKVAANYPFGRSRRFPGIRGHRDYSRLSCGGGETQLGPSAEISAGFLERALGHRGASPLLQRISADPEMIRGPLDDQFCSGHFVSLHSPDGREAAALHVSASGFLLRQERRRRQHRKPKKPHPKSGEDRAEQRKGARSRILACIPVLDQKGQPLGCCSSARRPP